MRDTAGEGVTMSETTGEYTTAMSNLDELKAASVQLEELQETIYGTMSGSYSQDISEAIAHIGDAIRKINREINNREKTALKKWQSCMTTAPIFQVP